MSINKRLLALISIFIFTFLPLLQAEKAPLLRVTYLNVGQGDAILLRSAEKTILIDAGDDRANAANVAIIPYLKKEGIKKIDTCVISHPHRDHFAGFIDLVQTVPIGEFLYAADFMGSEDGDTGGSEAQLYQKLHFAIMEKNIEYNQVTDDMKFDWGTGIKVDLFHTAESLRYPEPTNPPVASAPKVDGWKLNANNQSLIFRVSAGKVSYMFTGDAEKEVEANMVAKYGSKLRSTVMKSGHHGSKTSNTPSFLEAVFGGPQDNPKSPRYAVISVGAKNSFGHPCQETFDSYDFFKVKSFRTDKDGTVESYTDGETVRFISNQSPLEFAQKPELISLTPNSATIQWKTNKAADSQVLFGTTECDQQKTIEHAVTVHTVTLTGLKADTGYKFQVVSHDARQPEQIVTFDGTLKTPAGDGQPLPKIAQMVTSKGQIFMKLPFKLTVSLNNPGNAAAKDLSVELYHTSMSPDTILSSQANLEVAAGGNLKVIFPTEINWIGKVNFLAVLKAGTRIIDTNSLEADVLPKLMLVDASHGNIDYYTGRFGGMKLDLAKNLGFDFRSVSKGFTAEILQDAFIAIIPDCEKEFTAAELTALKGFVAKGGSLMLFSKADYKNTSHPQNLNKVLEGVGSGIRFNDDQVIDPTNNIGAPWRFFITTLHPKIITGVEKLLTWSACSMLNSKMEGLKESKDIVFLAQGDADTANIESDGMNDGYIYASHTPLLPVPIVVGEDLGFGRIACFGEIWYDDKHYAPTQQLQVPPFNRCVAAWLAQAKEKKLKDLVKTVARLNEVVDPELRAMRFETLKSEIEAQAESQILLGNTDEVKDAFSGQSDPSADKIKQSIKSNLLFKSMHQEEKRSLDESLKDF